MFAFFDQSTPHKKYTEKAEGFAMFSSFHFPIQEIDFPALPKRRKSKETLKRRTIHFPYFKIMHHRNKVGRFNVSVSIDNKFD